MAANGYVNILIKWVIYGIVILCDVIHKHRLLFVSDWSRRRPSISVSKMDGTGFRYLIISGVYWPNGIALDRENLRIYWIDAYLDKMESASYSGQDRHLLIDASYTFHPYDIVFYKGYVFWSSIFNGTMHQARVRNNTAVNQMIVRGVIYGPAQFQMVDLYNPRPGGIMCICLC